jgi:hypothetical protein
MHLRIRATMARNSTSEKLATVFAIISMPIEIIDNRTSITIQTIGETAT